MEEREGRALPPRDWAKELGRLERYRVLDDTFMRAVLRDNLPLAQHVLRVLTGLRDLALVEAETQRDVKSLVGSRSAVLDAYGADDAGRVYDLEVQRGSGLDPLRFRYYGSGMDADWLPAREDYRRLPERWVVVVLEGDPDGPGRARRHYRTREDDGSELGDRAHLLYVNAQWRGDDELGALMADFCQSDPGLIRDGLLRERVEWLKRSPEGVKVMCEISEEILQEGIDIGRKEGLKEGLKEGHASGRMEALAESVRGAMSTLGLSAEAALAALRVPDDDRPLLLAQL